MKVAVLQQSYDHNILQKTRDKVVSASRNADLILLHELHTSRYFCHVEDYVNFSLADNYDSECDYFSNLARECRVVIVTSLFEKRAKGIYHNTSVVFDRDGSIAGKYRKMHIPHDPQFYEKFYFTPGDEFEPIKTSVGNIGVLICWDQWFPEAARIMALKGADLLVYPTSIGYVDADSDDDRTLILDSWITIQRSHAIANGIPVIAINRVGLEGGIDFFGNSFVALPQGQIIAMAGTGEEILYAELDYSHTDKIRNVWPFLRDRRIDSYKALLNRSDN